MMSERERFAHVVNALSQDTRGLVTDLITSSPADQPYSVLKERLMLAHQLTPVQQATKVLAMPPLGDRRPSQLLADLLEYCPTGVENMAFFRAAFVQRLPADLQILLDGTDDRELKQHGPEGRQAVGHSPPSGCCNSGSDPGGGGGF